MTLGIRKLIVISLVGAVFLLGNFDAVQRRGWARMSFCSDFVGNNTVRR